MTKVLYRYFFDFIHAQEAWLNNMANQGYRLEKCGKLRYEFEKCQPDEYEYAVEFVADRPFSEAMDYRQFLEGMGYRVFIKSINLNFSIGKVKWRPWAKSGAKWATSSGSFNKELLIVEKRRDGKPLQLHTNVRDLLSGYRAVRKAYLWAAGQMLGLLALVILLAWNQVDSSRWLQWGIAGYVFIFMVLWAVPAITYSRIIRKTEEETAIGE